MESANNKERTVIIKVIIVTLMSETVNNSFPSVSLKSAFAIEHKTLPPKAKIQYNTVINKTKWLNTLDNG